MTAPGNILMLMTDQHRVDTLGCYGNGVCRTPNLDALAARGATFDNAFTPSAICTPTRASLLTGVLPFRHALLANYERNVGYREELGTEFGPFSTQLAAAGYQLGNVGKWHVGKVRGPEDFGFTGTHFLGWANPVRHPEYLSWLQERGLPEYRLQSEVRGTFPNGEPGNLLGGVLAGPVESTFEYFLADRAIAQLREFATTGRPFYLACNWFGPHLPYCIPAEYYRRSEPADVALPASIVETFADKPRVQRSYSAHWTFDSIGRADATPTRDYVTAETTLADGKPGGAGEPFFAEHWTYPRDSLNVSVRTPRERYIFRSDDIDELYDHRVDPGERVNLADMPEHQARRRALRQLLATEIGDSFAGAAELLST